jgi:probable HAF family extracellular repeat protein
MPAARMLPALFLAPVARVFSKKETFMSAGLARSCSIPVFLLLLVSALSAQPQYTATDLGWSNTGPGGGGYNTVVNNNGQVAGSGDWNYYSGAVHAYFYSGGNKTEIPSLGGNVTYVNAINNLGQVVGLSNTPGNAAGHAFRYSGGATIDLGTFPGGTYSWATGINDSGQIVGYANTATGVTHAFLWSPTSGMTDLGALLPGSANSAGAINSAGDIVGDYTTSGGVKHAFLRTKAGVFTDLGALIGGGSLHSSAVRINNNGQVLISAGWSDFWGGQTFLYSGGVMTPLSPLSGFSGVYPGGLNNNGQVVGELFCCRGYLYSGGTMTDLSTLGLGVTVGIAQDINDSGQIVTWPQAYLLTPATPPPACNPPRTIYPDFTGFAGFSDATVSNTQPDGNCALKADVRIMTTAVSFWRGVDIVTTGGAAEPNPNLSAGVEGAAASLKLLPPCRIQYSTHYPFISCGAAGAAAWTTNFTSPGGIQFTLHPTVRSEAVGAADILISLAFGGGMPQPITTVVGIADSLYAQVPAFKKAADCAAAGFSTQNTACISSAFLTLLRDSTQRAKISNIFRDAGLNIGTAALASAILGTPASWISILGTRVAYDYETNRLGHPTTEIITVKGQ